MNHSSDQETNVFDLHWRDASTLQTLLYHSWCFMWCTRLRNLWPASLWDPVPPDASTSAKCDIPRSAVCTKRFPNWTTAQVIFVYTASKTVEESFIHQLRIANFTLFCRQHSSKANNLRHQLQLNDAICDDKQIVSEAQCVSNHFNRAQLPQISDNVNICSHQNYDSGRHFWTDASSCSSERPVFLNSVTMSRAVKSIYQKDTDLLPIAALKDEHTRYTNFLMAAVT